MDINSKLKSVHEQANKIYKQAEEYNTPLIDDLIRQLKELRDPYLEQMEELKQNEVVMEYIQAQCCFNTIQDYIGWLISYYPK